MRRVDGSKVRIFATVKQAESAARSIGWPVGCVVGVCTRFQLCYALSTGIAFDKYTGLTLLSREWFAELVASRPASSALAARAGGAK